MAKTDTAITSLVFNLKRTGQYNASIKKVLGQSVNDILTNTQFIFNLVESDIFQFQYRTTAKDFFNVTTTAIDKTYETLYQVLIPTVTTLIQQHRLETINILYTSLATIMLCFLALLYLAIGIYIVSVKNIASIAQATEAFSQGDFSQRIQFDAKSELKYLAHSFNRMASELARLMATEKQEKLRIKAIMDSALDALIQINSKGEIIGWSHQAEQIFGWTAKETLGLNIHELIIPARYQEKYFLASEEGTIINQAVEIEALHRDGYEFPIELSIVPIKMNNCFEFNAFIRDISERKRTEENLQLFAQIFNEAYEGIMITDTQGFITEVNPAFVRLQATAVKKL